jgi:hypothetical protein
MMARKPHVGLESRWVRHIVARQNVAFPNGLHRIMLFASRAFPSLQYASGSELGLGAGLRTIALERRNMR